jgi:hypothetical protein
MYLTKKQWTIIAVVAGLVAIYFLFIRKNKIPESSYTRIPKAGEFGNKTIAFPQTIESSFDNDVLPLIGSENGYSGALNRSGDGALNRSSNYVPMPKSTYPKTDPGKGNQWCCAAYGENRTCKQWVITPATKKCL